MISPTFIKLYGPLDPARQRLRNPRINYRTLEFWHSHNVGIIRELEYFGFILPDGSPTLSEFTCAIDPSPAPSTTITDIFTLFYNIHRYRKDHPELFNPNFITL